MLPVAEHHVADVAYAEPVHKHPSGRYGREAFHIILVKLHNVAYVAYENVFRFFAHSIRKAGVFTEMLLLAVYGYEILWLNYALHELQFFLAGVP